MHGFSLKPPKHLSVGHYNASFNSTAALIKVDNGLGTYKIGIKFLREYCLYLSFYSKIFWIIYLIYKLF